nr:hypothetical protein [Tanacetum cinerariifolium]
VDWKRSCRSMVFYCTCLNLVDHVVRYGSSLEWSLFIVAVRMPSILRFVEAVCLDDGRGLKP